MNLRCKVVFLQRGDHKEEDPIPIEGSMLDLNVLPRQGDKLKFAKQYHKVIVVGINSDPTFRVRTEDDDDNSEPFDATIVVEGMGEELLAGYE